jgi:hypothetical protein
VVFFQDFPGLTFHSLFGTQPNDIRDFLWSATELAHQVQGDTNDIHYFTYCGVMPINGQVPVNLIELDIYRSPEV